MFTPGSGEKPSLADEKPAFIFNSEGICWYLKGVDLMSAERLSALCSFKKRVLSFSIYARVPVFPESNSSLDKFYLFSKQENMSKMSLTSFKERVYSTEAAHHLKVSIFG